MVPTSSTLLVCFSLCHSTPTHTEEAKKRRCETGSWWVTFVAVILGFLAAAALCFKGWNGVNVLEDSQLCIVMDEEFSAGSLDDTNWTLDVELGGFGYVPLHITVLFVKPLH
ncbi:hypothetical protein DFJ58DRAFT_790396 [Suillus subalutaceus]|uniref:uncharacterized protein n=1 Tax=Suillus subalutaceus TaxID=48586 RepID=UPI001B886C94|nr:uncharacterized protein DFJ58DRAFT_790396 [Suillus subalutaceus]KAG1852876.1 hypothetical protein DFJ58DRAFT_790396 [Suillus subalutaceus]